MLTKKLIKKNQETNKMERLTVIICKNADGKIMRTWNSIPDARKIYLKKMAFDILINFPASYFWKLLI